MVRDWKELLARRGHGDGGAGSGEISLSSSSSSAAFVMLLLWAAFVTFAVISAVIFSCADGVPKDKTSSSATHTGTHGATCAAAGCSAGCGAWSETEHQRQCFHLLISSFFSAMINWIVAYFKDKSCFLLQLHTSVLIMITNIFFRPGPFYLGFF